MQILKKKYWKVLLVMACIFVSPVLFAAEDASSSDEEVVSEAPKTSEVEGAREFVSKKLQDLWSEGNNKKASSIILLEPLNFLKKRKLSKINEAVEAALNKFGTFNILSSSESLTSLTLESFRRAAVRTKAAIVLIVSIQKDTTDVYLYDKAVPFYVYGFSQPYETEGEIISLQFLQKNAVIALQRTLLRYLKNQYFELPREEVDLPVKSDVPRWLTSSEPLKIVNREATSSFFIAAGVGTAFAREMSPEYWNTAVLNLDFGFHFKKNIAIDLGWEIFTRNAFFGGLKYYWGDSNSKAKVSVGLGVAYLFGRKSIDYSPVDREDQFKVALVPSAAFLFPIVDIWFKIESKLYLGIVGKGTVISLSPGVQVNF